MAASKLYNLARMSTATTGTGTITLGSAVSGFLSFASAGVLNGETVTYAIRDGANSEIGRGTYTSSGTTLTRTVLKSTNSDAAISLSGTAEVFITPAAEDLGQTLFLNVEDYGADPSGAADSAAAFGSWWADIISTGKPGYIGPGVFKLSSQLNWDVNGRANGIHVFGAGPCLTELRFDAGVTAPNLTIQHSGDAGIFYAQFRDFFVSGNINGKLVQLGQSDFSDAFNHCRFDFVAQNTNLSSGNVAVEVNYSVFGDHRIVANCSGNGNGIALDVRQCVSCLWWGGGGNADIAYRLSGNTYSNTFLNVDHEEVDIGLQALTSTVANNTWVGPIFSICDDAAFDMQAGRNNVVIGETIAASGATALASDGLVMENWQERVIAAWAGTTSHTGNTNETTLATISIPAAALGPNGYLEVLCTWEMTNNGNTKTMFGRLGGTGGAAFLQYALASSATAQTLTVISNVNSQSSQIGSHSNYQGVGNTAGALITAAVDTSVATTFVISGKLGNSGDTITLKRYVVKVCYRP